MHEVSLSKQCLETNARLAVPKPGENNGLGQLNRANIRQVRFVRISIVNMVWVSILCNAAVRAQTADPWTYDAERRFAVALPADSPLGEASIREHAICWHPKREKFYLVADVVPLASRHHPNTYDTQLYLWSSPNLADWTLHGLAVPKGLPERHFDGFGTASPAGMAYLDGRLYVPYSARRTPRFTQRSIGLAYSGDDPEHVPWTKLDRPISDLVGEDDDAAALAEPGTGRLHVYHRTTGPGGYRIVRAWSDAPNNAARWRPATPVTERPADVRAQELTGVARFDGRYHLFVIEHLTAGGIKIAHLICDRPEGPFEPLEANRRYIERQPAGLAYGGHFTPVVQGGSLRAIFWTASQQGRRYGLLGHPMLQIGP